MDCLKRAVRGFFGKRLQNHKLGYRKVQKRCNRSSRLAMFQNVKKTTRCSTDEALWICKQTSPMSTEKCVKLIQKVKRDNVVETREKMTAVRVGRYEERAAHVVREMDEYYMAIRRIRSATVSGDTRLKLGSSANSTRTVLRTDCRASAQA